jgi:hypothetical protein
MDYFSVINAFCCGIWCGELLLEYDGRKLDKKWKVFSCVYIGVCIFRFIVHPLIMMLIAE